MPMTLPTALHHLTLAAKRATASGATREEIARAVGLHLDAPPRDEAHPIPDWRGLLNPRRDSGVGS